MNTKRTTVILVGMCFLLVLVYLFAPIRNLESRLMPAIILQTGSQRVQNTDISLTGAWSHPRLFPAALTFSGKIFVDGLEYTHRSENWKLNIQFEEETSFDRLCGGFFYNSDADTAGFGWLYTEKSHECFVLITNRLSSDSSDNIVIAPAETIADAKAICDTLGFVFLQQSTVEAQEN